MVAPVPLVFKPGINTQATPLLLEQGWSSSNLIRFKDGLLQKLGGCAHMIAQAFIGICRGMLVWSDLSANTYVALGTTQRLEVITNSLTLSDITPITAVHNLTAPFTTTAGSPIVTVADGSADVLPGDWIDIQTAAYIDGIFLQGFYQVLANVAGGYTFNAGTNAIAGVSGGGVTTRFTTTTSSHTVAIVLGSYVFTNGQAFVVFDSTTVGGLTIQGSYTVAVAGSNYSITASTTASSGASAFENGGEVAIGYLLGNADESAAGSAAYGMGLYGAGSYGTSNSVAPFDGWLRQWSMDAWGEDLLAGATNGPIYTWTPPVAIGNTATVLENAPVENIGFFVNTPEQQVIAYGCTDPNTGEQDPLLVRFCDVGDNTDWTASATNQAGSFRLSSGNLIVSGLAIGGSALLLTDLDAWLMQYISFPLVYGFQRIARECGLYAKRTLCISGNVVIWRGQNDYHQYDGSSVTPLRCTVWDFIFNNIDNNYPGAGFMVADAFFTEIFDFFPTVGSNGQCNAYVKFNYKDGLWDISQIGSISRSAGAPEGPTSNPLLTDYNGLVQIQELATDLDGVAMDSWAQSGWLALSEGDEYVLMKWFLPDFIMTGNVVVTLLFSDYADITDPNNPVRTYGPYTITSTTPYVWVNGRGRYFAIKVESIAAGVFWRLGRCKAIVQPDGKR